MKYLWPIVMWMCSHTMHAQVYLDQVSLREGLSQSEVQAIIQDSHGYMWFGTQDGLNRYDGLRIRQYHQEPFAKETLSGERVSLLFEDSRQQLWVGTEQGLCRYDRQRDKFIPEFTLPRNDSHPGKVKVTSLVEDRWHTLWIGTTLGLWRLVPLKDDPAKFMLFQYKEKDGLSSLIIYGLAKDAHENIWIATYNGLNKIIMSGLPSNTQKISFENSTNHTAAIYKTLQMPLYKLQYSHGKLWTSSGNRLFCLSPSSMSVQELTPQLCVADNQITAFWLDHTGVMWIGTFGSGVFRYVWQPTEGKLQLLEHIGENRYQENGLKSSSILALYEGHDVHEDLVWLGTREAGVHTYSRSKNSFHNWSDVLSKERRATEVSVFSMCTDSYGNLWAGTMQGLVQIDRRTRKTQYWLIDDGDMETNVIFSLFEDLSKTLWIGTAHGLYWWDRTHRKFICVPLPSSREDGKPVIKKVLEDKDGNLWVVSLHYLVSLKKEKNTYRVDRFIRHFSNPKETIEVREIWDAGADSTGNFWIGMNNGLVRANLQTGSFEHFVYGADQPEGIMSNTILSVYVDAAHQLWLCSPKGLSKMVQENGKTRFVHFTKRNGLPNSFVYGALGDDQHRIWVSTNSGIACLDTQTMQFKNYDTNDGLTNQEFNSGAFHKSKDGELFFGGIGVLVSFHPEQMIENKHLPQVNVSSFQLNQKEVRLDSLQTQQGVLEVKYHDFFAFFLSVTDYTNPSKNQLLYKLEGLQDNWVPMDKPHIGIADVRPGNYMLHVKGANNQGYWNEKNSLKIPIYIIPPFWQTWWFYGLVGLAAALVGMTLYRYRVRMKIKRILERETIKSEENERVRKLTAQDMHDEFGNGLTRISLLTEMVKTKVNGHGTEVSPLLEKISDNAQQLYQGTKDFIWSINPEHDNFYEIAIRLKDFGEDIFDRTPAQFEVSGLAELLKGFPLPMDTSRHLVLIFKEAMSNTLKHAQATKVWLLFQTQKNILSIEWKDNGQGFDVSEAQLSQGILNMKTRASKIGGTLDITSKKNTGTSISLFMNITHNG